MESPEDKQRASRYLLVPSEETGPGTRYGFMFAPDMNTQYSSAIAAEKEQAKQAQRNSNPFRDTASGPAAYPSPPNSASPRQSRFAHRPEAFGDYSPTQRRPSSANRPSSEFPTSSASSSLHDVPIGRQRGSSLTSRFPGDTSDRPLVMLRAEARRAHRAPHLHKSHLPGADSIDRLDNVTGQAFHHDGPFDATLMARNASFLTSPVEAVAGTNEAALRATPRERVLDSIRRHRPLDGVAATPSRWRDPMGRVLHYDEGADLMAEAGFRRIPGHTYLPGDRKGKGEPSYSIEKALKEHAAAVSTEQRPWDGRRRSSGVGDGDAATEAAGLRRSNTEGKRRNVLARRFGSPRRRGKAATD